MFYRPCSPRLRVPSAPQSTTSPHCQLRATRQPLVRKSVLLAQRRAHRRGSSPVSQRGRRQWQRVAAAQGGAGELITGQRLEQLLRCVEADKWDEEENPFAVINLASIPCTSLEAEEILLATDGYSLQERHALVDNALGVVLGTGGKGSLLSLETSRRHPRSAACTQLTPCVEIHQPIVPLPRPSLSPCPCSIRTDHTVGSFAGL